MATKSSTDIKLNFLGKSALQVIQILLDFGWSCNENGEIWYLPLRDEGMFNWTKQPISEWNKVTNELQEKDNRGEVIGIDLLWDGSSIGGQFHFNFEPNLLSINWNINRKPLKSNPEKTDLEWYEPKVVIPLLKAGLDIYLVQSEDVDSGGDIINKTYCSSNINHFLDRYPDK